MSELGCWSDQGSEIDDESEISHAVRVVSATVGSNKYEPPPGTTVIFDVSLMRQVQLWGERFCGLNWKEDE